MLELRLPTIAVPVRLALVGHDADGAELFLSDVARRGRGQLIDDLVQMLDEPAAFLPVRVGENVRLLGKHAISWISIEFPDEPSDQVMLYDRQHLVEIEMIEGKRLSGTILSSSPADRPRAIDHLNRAVHFVRLWTPEHHFVINKHQIVGVTELEVTPA